MTRYFYDKTTGAVIRVDEDTLAMEQLLELGTPMGETRAPIVDAPTAMQVGKRSYNRKPKDAAPPRGKAGCSECGSPTMHHKGCSMRTEHRAKKPRQEMDGNDQWKDLGEVTPPFKGMSQMTFGRVKISQHNDIPTEVIARNLSVPVDEVEKAFDVDTYADYKNLG